MIARYVSNKQKIPVRFSQLYVTRYFFFIELAPELFCFKFFGSPV